MQPNRPDQNQKGAGWWVRERPDLAIPELLTPNRQDTETILAQRQRIERKQKADQQKEMGLKQLFQMLQAIYHFQNNSRHAHPRLRQLLLCQMLGY